MTVGQDLTGVWGIVHRYAAIMTYTCVQEDCQVCLNTVENIEQFLLDINQGRWDTVLPQITHLRLPTEKLYDLYEQIVCEMIELRETDTAHAMLRTMKVFKRLQHDDAERFMRLDRMSNPCAHLNSLSPVNATQHPQPSQSCILSARHSHTGHHPAR